MSSHFKSYSPYIHSKCVRTADGTSQQIHGVGSIACTPSINLSFVLHIPSFPVNLIAISSIIDQFKFKCTITFDENYCVFKERGTGKVIGTGVRHDGL